MSRAAMFWLAAGLAVGGIASLWGGVAMLQDNLRSHLAGQYREYSRQGDAILYACNGSPAQVANGIAAHKSPIARASDRGSEYLRYSDDIVIVGPDGSRPCTVRVEDTDSRYSQGGFVYLGPGFHPGAPSGGSGGSPGGPDGGK